MSRVVVIFVAEATFDLVRPFVEAGKLPAFAELLNGGTSAVVKAPFPLGTAERWASLITGRTAGNHGIYDFFQRGADGRMHEIAPSDLAATSIWQRASDAGRSIAAVNVPLMYPPEPVRGYVLAGADAPGIHRSICEPPRIYDELVEQFGSYPFAERFRPGRRSRSSLRAELEHSLPLQARALAYLIRKHPCDFSFFWTGAVARAQHDFWGDHQSSSAAVADGNDSIVVRAYELVDGLIAQVRDAAGEGAAVFVMSDCGAGPLLGGVNVPACLERNGLFVRKAAREPGRPTLIQRAWRAIPFHRIRPDLLAWYLLPRALFPSVAKRLRAIRERMQAGVYQSDVDWSRTRAFAHGVQGGIVVNLAGREHSGIVHTGTDYDDTCREVAAALEALRDPRNGEPVVRRVLHRDEVYSGPYSERAADLLIDWAGDAYLPTEREPVDDSCVVARTVGEYDYDTKADHRPEGILLFERNGRRSPASLHDVRTLDLVPTWLRMLGLPIPNELEGLPIASIAESEPKTSQANTTDNSDSE